MVSTFTPNHEGRFAGFDEGVQPGSTVLRLLGENASEPAQIHLDFVSMVSDSNGNNIDVEVIKRLAAAGTLPKMSALVLQSEQQRALIPLDTVGQVNVRVAKNGKLIGSLVGAAVDVAIISILDSQGVFKVHWETSN